MRHGENISMYLLLLVSWGLLVASISCTCFALHFNPVESTSWYQRLEEDESTRFTSLAAKGAKITHSVKVYTRCALLFFLLSGLVLCFYFITDASQTQEKMKLPMEIPVIEKKNSTGAAKNATK